NAEWLQVWQLYNDNADLFGGVFSHLRKQGVYIEPERQVDLLHEFLLERAPSALRTFRPHIAPLRPWLFVVFRRFVHASLRAEARRREQLERHEPALSLPQEESESPADVQAARQALDKLSREQRRALMLFLASGKGSIREVARTLNISRFRADQLVTNAV